MKKSEIWFGIARIPVDFGMTLVAFLIAYRLRLYTDLIPGMHFPVDLLNFPTLTEYLTLALWAAAALVIVFAVNQMYALRNTARIANEVIKVIFLVSAWIMLIIAFYFVTRQFFFSRLVLGYIWIFTALSVSSGRILIRIFQRYLTRFGIGRRRILFIGNNILTKRIAEKFKLNPSYHIIGTLTNLKDLSKIIEKEHVEEIIQTKSELSETQAQDIIDFCREHHIQYHFVPDILQVHRTQVDMFNIAGLPLISLKITPLDGWGKVIKRGMDLFISIPAFIILLPFFALLALIIKINSRGPILFTKKDDGKPVVRIGYKGRPFKFYKFRTMKHKTDSLRYGELGEKSHRKNSPLVKIKNDPRITTFGRFLRRWSIDELPQLWSVIRGTMSLVGPRPHLPEEVAKYEKHHKFSLSIKPGVSGLAQINGRSDLDFEEEVRFDTYYIENWSPLLDLKIIIRTIFVILGGKGAD